MSTHSSVTVTVTVTVKTLAGGLLSVPVEEDLPSCEFTARVHALLEEPRPPMAFMRFLPANNMDAEVEEKSKSELLSFHDGDVFFLLVEDPNVFVWFQWQDDAILNRTGDSLKYMRLVIEDHQKIELMNHAFYVMVTEDYEIKYNERTGKNYPFYRFTDIVYDENDVRIIYNQGTRVRMRTGQLWRNVNLNRSATPYVSPVFFALRYSRPEWIPYLSDKIYTAWQNYIETTTGENGPRFVEDRDFMNPKEDV